MNPIYSSDKENQLPQKEKVVLFVGNGGVGKTTLATLFAIQSARKNLKTLLLTIDPSKRLSSLLGLQAESGKIVQIEEPRLNGKLFATCVVPEIEFKNFMSEHIKDVEVFEKLKENILYKQFSSTIGESQDFTSLYKMASLINNNDYDLIVLDTPPAINSKNFFESAVNIHKLLDNKVFSTFLKINSYSESKIMNFIKLAAYRSISLLGRVAGKEFAKALFDFFSVVQIIESEVKKVSLQSDSILKSSQSKIYLVSDLSHSIEQETKVLLEYFEQKNYQLDLIFINRVMALHSKVAKYPESEPYQKEASKQLNLIIDLFREVESSQNLLLNHIKDNTNKKPPLIKVPEFKKPPTSIESLVEIAESLSLDDNTERVSL